MMPSGATSRMASPDEMYSTPLGPTAIPVGATGVCVANPASPLARDPSGEAPSPATVEMVPSGATARTRLLPWSTT